MICTVVDFEIRGEVKRPRGAGLAAHAYDGMSYDCMRVRAYECTKAEENSYNR